MAKPMFCDDVPSLEVPATAVFMPMTWPDVSMSGPPELPGLMAASVWIMFWRVSVCVPSPPAVTERPSAEMMPWVTVGVPAARPERVADGHHGVADDGLARIAEGDGRQVGRVVDLEERHVLGLVVADERRGQRLGLAVLGDRDGALVAALAVELNDVVVGETSPSEVMIMPVPSSSLPFDLTSMETTEWITLSTSCGMVTLPLSTAAPGAALLSWMVTLAPPLPLLLLSARAVTPAPMAPPMRAATMRHGEPGPQLARRAAPPAPGGVEARGRSASPEGGYENGTAVGVTGVAGRCRRGRRRPRAGRGRRVRRARAGRGKRAGSGCVASACSAVGRGRCRGLRHRVARWLSDGAGPWPRRLRLSPRRRPAWLLRVCRQRDPALAARCPHSCGSS